VRISLNWLEELVEIRDRASLAQALTFAGLEVERVDELGAGLEQVRVARILSSVPHPKADRLSVTEVDAGDRRLQIVCGAKNYRVGDLVPLAPPGTVLPGGLQIEEAELRGVKSLGMLCSQEELGLSLGNERSEGLLILPPARGQPGQRFIDALPVRDTVFEINVTPNRADCLSHLGVAREVAALTGASLKSIPRAPPAKGAESGLSAPRLHDPDRCGRFLGQPVSASGLHAPSPFTMRYRLQACGVRPIGLAVDATNYVMLELGQPLHAYDLDKLRHGIVVRLARRGEKLVTLDGVERVLDHDDLLICDGEIPVGLAGVMGGRDTEIGELTRRFYLEAASFEPGGIRRAAKRHGLPSEASHRFERGVDPELPARALDRVVAILATAGAAPEAGEIQSADGNRPEPRRVKLRFARAAELLGRPVSAEEAVRRLRSVGIAASSQGSGEASFDIPSHRQDLSEAVDLISEIGRLTGYEAIPASAPARGFASPSVDPRDRLEGEARQALGAAGFSETIHYSFTSAAALDAFSAGPRVAIVNPLGQEMGVMRSSLLPSLCDSLRRNLAHLTRDAGVAPAVRLYEIARTYRWPGEAERPEGPAVERSTLGLVWHGPRLPLSWGNARDPADAADLRGLLEALAARLRKPLFSRAAVDAPAFLHPRSAVDLLSDGVRVGVAGEIHPAVAKAADLPRQLLLAEIDLDAMLAAEDLPRRAAVPRFPAVLRDMAFIVGRELPQAKLEACLASAAGELLESLLLFDVYEGQPLAAGEKSLAYSLRFRAPDRTLTDSEVASLQAAMAAEVERRFKARLRA